MTDADKTKMEMFYPTFENAPVAMALVSPQGRFLSVNAALTRMLEYSKDELLSMSFGEVTHPDDLSASKEWVEKLLAGGETTIDLEKRYIRKSGQVVWGIVRSFLLRGADGNPLFFITHVQDITERKRSEEAILSERNFANAALNSLPGIFYMFDPAGRFLRWNRNFEEVTEYSPEEIARMSPLDFFLGADKVLIEERIKEVFARGASDAEANLVSKSGKQTPYYFTGRTIQAEGNPCLIGMGIDITEHRSLEEQLRESQKMEAVGRLAGGIAHDFNNLLTVIIGYSELLLSKIGKDKPLSQEAGEIRIAAQRAASLTSQLLCLQPAADPEPRSAGPEQHRYGRGEHAPPDHRGAHRPRLEPLRSSVEGEGGQESHRTGDRQPGDQREGRDAEGGNPYDRDKEHPGR